MCIPSCGALGWVLKDLSTDGHAKAITKSSGLKEEIGVVCRYTNVHVLNSF